MRRYLHSYASIVFSLSLALFPLTLSAQMTANPAACDEVFGLPKGTQEQGVDKKLVGNAEVCEAYKFLITRYDIGGRSSPCIKSKAQGITGLNPDFAVALAKMLKAAPNMRIISALRPSACQGSTNPNSNHTVGCAVDLGYTNSNCNSQECKWVQTNSKTFGIQIRMPYSPEWNHVEPINVQVCRAKGPGGGISPSGAPVQAPPATRAPANPFANPSNPTQVPPPPPPPPPTPPLPQQPTPTGGSSTGSPTPTSVPSSPSPNPTSVANPTPTQTTYPTLSNPSNPTTNPITTTPPYTVPPTTVTDASKNTTSTSSSSHSAIDEITAISGSDTSKSASVPTATSAPVKLNSDLVDATGIDPSAPSFPSDVPTSTSTPTSIDSIHSSDTFSSGPVNPVAATQTSTTSSDTLNKSLIASLLNTIKILLVSIINKVNSGNSYGFQGSWQPVTILESD